MRGAFVVAGHHLRRTVRTPGLILLLLAVPLTIAAIEYAAFGRSAASGKLPPIKVAILDEDDTFASQAVPQLFSGGPLKDTFEVSGVEDVAASRRLLQRGEASAVVRVPKGFQKGLLDGSAPPLEIYKNPAQTVLPDVVRSVLEMGVVLGNGLYAQAREPVARIRQLFEDDREPTTEEVAAIAVGFYLAGKRLNRFEGLEDLDVVLRRPDGGGGESGEKGPFVSGDPGAFFAFIFPGLVQFSLLFISGSLALRLLRDRSRGLMRRLAITPLSRDSILAGNALYVIVALCTLLLVLGAIGALIFRIRLREPVALLALGTGFAVFAGGLQLAIVAAARNDRSAQGISGIAIILLSLLGGTFVPVENYPPVLRSVAMAIPNGAAQQGLVDVLAHESSFGDVATGVVTVWAWAVVALVAATWLERRRLVS